MKRILLIFLFTTIIHGQVYDNIETAIGNLVNDLRNDVEISFNSRSIIGSISTGRNIPSKIAEKIRKEIIRSHNLRSGFNIISHEYTNYISKKLSNRELIEIAKKADADYIIRILVDQESENIIEIYLICIDVSSMTERGLSVLTKYHLDEFITNYSKKQFLPGYWGLFANYGFLQPSNYYFKNNLAYTYNFDTGIIFSLLSFPFLDNRFDNFVELGYSSYGSKFRENVSLLKPFTNGSTTQLQRINYSRFQIYSGKLAFNFLVRIFDPLTIKSGIGFTYGELAVFGKQIVENTNSNWNERNTNSQKDIRTRLLFFSPSYSLGVILHLSKTFYLYAEYFESFNTPNTEWKGIKTGIIFNMKHLERKK